MKGRAEKSGMVFIDVEGLSRLASEIKSGAPMTSTPVVTHQVFESGTYWLQTHWTLTEEYPVDLHVGGDPFRASDGYPENYAKPPYGGARDWIEGRDYYLYRLYEGSDGQRYPSPFQDDLVIPDGHLWVMEWYEKDWRGVVESLRGASSGRSLSEVGSFWKPMESGEEDREKWKPGRKKKGFEEELERLGGDSGSGSFDEWAARIPFNKGDWLDGIELEEVSVYVDVKWESFGSPLHYHTSSIKVRQPKAGWADAVSALVKDVDAWAAEYPGGGVDMSSLVNFLKPFGKGSQQGERDEHWKKNHGV